VLGTSIEVNHFSVALEKAHFEALFGARITFRQNTAIVLF